MNKTVSISALALLAAAAYPEPAPEQMVLSNSVVQMTINRHGGAVASFVLTDLPLNPLSWVSPRFGKNDVSLKTGHFVCFDRIGPPSELAKKLGIPQHGEATSVGWEVLKQKPTANGDQLLQLQCNLPAAKMSLVRTFCLFNNTALCKVTDRIQNLNPQLKPYNIMQHPCIAPPFLDQQILIDCNAGEGFLDTKNKKALTGPLFTWPNISAKDQPVNLRQMTDGNDLMFDGIIQKGAAYGWSTVANPEKALLIGYLWPAADYPWIRVWRQFDQTQPKALSVEFSTSPLGIPLEDLEGIGPLLNTPIIEKLEPAQETEKTFYVFLVKIDKNFTGVKSATITDGRLDIQPEGSGKSWHIPLR